MDFHTTPPTPWRTSRRCGASQACVEVARRGGRSVAVRDGGGQPGDEAETLTFSVREWRRFSERAKDGGFDLA
ncbi:MULTISPECIES: DUF397 domain-containing protein [Thermomonosporaceae]|uniref:DUF397 domain-containing protein n=1 Tax=Thermomonosporaceae TaxID=2012 RepID=UPI00255B1F14|nr:MULTISPECIES: DUF397 domain-containing protein [Thermomonosporaceae]MDL4776235.1 DUF397 domain-containing protein [Actinomadura xylanilytica]